jgi:hypothetical protein
MAETYSPAMVVIKEGATVTEATGVIIATTILVTEIKIVTTVTGVETTQTERTTRKGMILTTSRARSYSIPQVIYFL